MKSAVRVREMCPHDLARVASAHRTAFAGFFLTQLGEPFLRLYYRHIVEQDEVAFVAERTEGRTLLGFVVGIGNSELFYRSLLQNHAAAFLRAALPAIARRPHTVVRRIVSATLRRVRSRPGGPQPEGTTTLTSIAVLPEAQGSGVGALLMAAFKECARARGARRIVLETDADRNEKVCQFYSAEGFQIYNTFVTGEGRRMHELELAL